MAFPTTAWYVNSVAYAAVTAWATGATIAAGALRRQSATPTVGNERVFAAIVGGTTHATTEPTWVVTRGAKNTDNTVTWQECTGQAAVNGDLTNTVAWSNAQIKNTALTLGTIIKDVAGTHLFILSTAGTAGNGAEPTWNVAAVGNTTADNTCTWTYIGLASSFTAAVAPHARIANAVATNWGVAGQNIYVGDNHAETQTSALTIANTSTTPFYVLCHNHSGSYPPASADLTTGATVTLNAGSAVLLDITAQALYAYGIEFKNTSSTTLSTMSIGDQATGAGTQKFENCKFTLGASAGNITLGGTSSNLQLNNCTFTFGATGQLIQLKGGYIRWTNSTAYGGATIPANLFQGAGTANYFEMFCQGVDFSAAGAGKTVCTINSLFFGYASFIDCKQGASSTLVATSSPAVNGLVDIVNCDSGTQNYRNERYGSFATLTAETTIVRTGGASDGTTPASVKVVTTASPLWVTPFESPPIAIWNETVGSSVTVTLFGIWGGGAVPNNDDFWIDVDYLSSSAQPISSRASSGKASILAANAALSSDASTWGGSTTPFKTSVTITPQMKGYIYVTPKMSKVSATLYYDTKLTVA